MGQGVCVTTTATGVVVTVWPATNADLEDGLPANLHLDKQVRVPAAPKSEPTQVSSLSFPSWLAHCHSRRAHTHTHTHKRHEVTVTDVSACLSLQCPFRFNFKFRR